MDRNSVFAFFVLCVLSSASFSAGDTSHIERAENLVTEYKELRNHCAAAKETARKQCFAQLEEKNEAYRSAKRILSADKSDNVRLVSFSN